MGASNGTYVPWHEPVWTHAKIKAAADALVTAGVPVEYAPILAGAALHRLSCWALRDGDTGQTGRLTDAELAQIAWPEGVSRGRWKPAKIGALLRQALHAKAAGYDVGCLEGDGGMERVHDFADHNRRVLFDRDRRRKERTPNTPSPDTPRTDPRTVHGQEGGQSVDSPRLARASGIPADRRIDIPASGGADIGSAPQTPEVRKVTACMEDRCGATAESGGVLCARHAALARGFHIASCSGPPARGRAFRRPGIPARVEDES